MRKIYLIFLAALTAVVSCGRSDNGGEVSLNLPESVKASKDYSAARPADVYELVSAVAVAPAGDEVISDYGQSLFYVDGGHFGLVDNKRVFLVDESDGKAALVIDKVGRGPGEYLDVLRCDWKDGNYMLTSCLSGKYITYDGGGELLSEKNFSRGRVFSALSDDTYAVCNFYGEKSDIDIYGADDSLVKSYKMSPEGVKSRMLSVQSLYEYDGDFFFLPAFSDTLYRVSVEEATPYLVFDAGQYAAPSDNPASDAPQFISNLSYRVGGDAVFCEFQHNERSYRTVWNTADGKLLFSTCFSDENGPFGFPFEVNGQSVSIWPTLVHGRDLFALLVPPDAYKLFPESAGEGPVVVHLRKK